MEFSAVPFIDTEGVMLPVSAVREKLAATEPGDSVRFWTGLPDLRAVYGKGWAEGEPTMAAPAWLFMPDGTCYQLTRQAASQLGSKCRVNQKQQEWLPVWLLDQTATWALTEGLGDKELQLFLAPGDGEGPPKEGGAEPDAVRLASAVCGATIEPFSNLRLLDVVLLATRAAFGHATADHAVVDYKFFNDLEHASFRVVFPDLQQTVAGEDDAWCYGIEVSNSPIGLKQLVVNGYMFRFSSTGGISDVENTAGGFSRRGSSPDEAYAWCAEAVTRIYEGMESAFNGLRALLASDMDEDYEPVMTQLFKESPVAKELQLRILEDLEGEPEELTMLHLAAAASETANLEDSTWRDVHTLLELAGHIVHQGGGMCRGQLENGCRRLLPPGREAPAAS